MEIFVPGRLCVLGEHTDWAGQYRDINGAVPYGMAIVCTTNEGLYGRCCEYQAGYLQYQCGEGGDDVKILECDIFGEDLAKVAQEGSFFSYVAGTIMAIIANESWANRLKHTGISIINYKTTLPMKKGLSSSAAVCVLVAQSFSALFNLNLEPSEIMELAYLGEMSTPSRCGRMDQCVCMGKDSIGLMEFNGSHCVLHRLFNPVPLHFVVADLKASKDTVVILRDLNSCFPNPNSQQEYAMHRYSHENQDLAWKAVLAITSGDIFALGEAMTQSQNLFNDCAVNNCPSELTAPILNRTINDPSLRHLHISAKGVGSQGDGSIQFLCDSLDQQTQLLSALTKDPWNYDAFALTIAPSPTSAAPSLSRERILTALIICQGDTCDGTTDALKDARLTNFLLELIACGIRQIKLLCLDNCKGVCGRIEPSSFVNSSPHWSYSDALRELLARYLTFQCIPRNEFLKDSSSVLREISETKIPTPELPIIFGTIRHHAPEEESVGLNRSSQIYDLLIPSIEPKKLKYQDGLQITAQVRSNPISDEELRDLLLKE